MNFFSAKTVKLRVQTFPRHVPHRVAKPGIHKFAGVDFLNEQLSRSSWPYSTWAISATIATALMFPRPRYRLFGKGRAGAPRGQILRVFRLFPSKFSARAVPNFPRHLPRRSRDSRSIVAVIWQIANSASRDSFFFFFFPLPPINPRLRLPITSALDIYSFVDWQINLSEE